MKKSNKIVAVLLALVMIITAVPMMTASADVGGYGDAVKDENKHKHVYVIQSEKEGSCTEPAKTTFKCECGDVKVMETGEPAHIPADSTSYKEKDEKVHTNYCKVCKELYEESHVEDDWQLVVDECIQPTCAKAGKNVYKCKKCGFKKTESLKATVHIPSGLVVKDDNKHSFTCSFCEKLIDEKHVWDEGHVDAAIKCGDSGKIIYKCLVAGCGKTKEETIPSACVYHEKEDIEKDPTLKIDNYDEKGHVFECIYCSKDKPETHAFVVTYGYVYGEVKYYNSENIFEFFAEGENAMPVAEEPTEAPTEVPSEKPTEVPSEKPTCAHEKTRTDETPATCEKDGVKVTYCEDCEAQLEKVEISATGHNFKDEVINKATCGKPGSKRIYCTNANCGYEKVEDIKPTNDHNGIWKFKSVPTAVKDGKQVLQCTECNKLIAERTVKLSIPTCKEEGRIHITCKYCNYVADEIVDTVDHKIDENRKCDDYTISQHKAYCQYCGDVVKLNHTWSDWEVTVNATADKEGEKVRICTGCGRKETAKIPKGTGMLGDVNGDNSITAIDARLILQYVAGLREFTAKEMEAADVNADGNVTAIDARVILQVVAGLRKI